MAEIFRDSADDSRGAGPGHGSEGELKTGQDAGPGLTLSYPDPSIAPMVETEARSSLC